MEADEVVNRDGGEEGTSDDINMEVDESNVDEAHTREGDEDGDGWNTVTTGHQTHIPERYRQEISASDLDTLCCESNYYQLLTGEDDKADDDIHDQDIACVGAGLVVGFVNLI
jgi:hypothetical protein